MICTRSGPPPFPRHLLSTGTKRTWLQTRRAFLSGEKHRGENIAVRVLSVYERLDGHANDRSLRNYLLKPMQNYFLFPLPVKDPRPCSAGGGLELSLAVAV